MTKQKFLLTIACFLLRFCSIQAEDSYAILNIESDKASEKVLASLTDFLSTEIKKNVSDSTKIYSWNDIQSMLSQTAKNQHLGYDDDKRLAALGVKLGATFLIAGTIGAVGDQYTLNLKIIDISKAQTIIRVSKSIIGSMGGFIDEIPSLAKQLLA